MVSSPPRRLKPGSIIFQCCNKYLDGVGPNRVSKHRKGRFVRESGKSRLRKHKALLFLLVCQVEGLKIFFCHHGQQSCWRLHGCRVLAAESKLRPSLAREGKKLSSRTEGRNFFPAGSASSEQFVSSAPTKNGTNSK